MSKPPGKNVASWKVVECAYCKKKLKDATKPFIKGAEPGDKIYCQDCADILFAHYFPPEKKKSKKPYNPSRRDTKLVYVLRESK